MNYIGYCLRVDALEGYGAKISALALCLDYKSAVAVRHTGVSKENPHYHIVVQTEVLGQAFRVRMRKIFDQGKGNAHMSIKPWDGNIDAIAYLFHEDPTAQLILQHNVSDETVAQARARNKQVSELVAASKSKASWHLESIVLSEIQSLPVPYHGWTATSIASKLILTALRNGKYVPQPWHVRAMTERIQFTLLNGSMEDEEAFASRLAQQIFNR